MHRGSARFNPEAPVTHHWFDSTHITFGVLTAGIGTDRWQVEASAFNGTEPNEERWGIDTPRLDSWAVRASWTPSPHWSAQISYAGIKEPEALHPGEAVGRLTASISYASSRLSVPGRSDEPTPELQSLMRSSYAVLRLKTTPPHYTT